MFGFAVAGVVKRQSIGMHADDFAEALCRSVEIYMPQKAADISRTENVIHIEPRKTVAGMPKGLMPEIHIVREECRRRLLENERDQVRVIRAGCGEFLPDFSRADAPHGKHSLLFQMEVFVQNQHGELTRVRELCRACGVCDTAGILKH